MRPADRRLDTDLDRHQSKNFVGCYRPRKACAVWPWKLLTRSEPRPSNMELPLHSQLTTDVCIGIDVACAVGKRLPICFVSGLNPLTPLKIPKPLANLIPRGVGNREVSKKAPFAEAAKSVVDAISHIAAEMRWSIKCIAIDAPAAPPNHCPRVSECELASKGLSVFQTPARDAWLTICENGIAHLLSNKSAVTLPCANKIWMLYGFELFTGLPFLSSFYELL